MATTYPELGNSANWTVWYEGDGTAEKLSDGTYRPIPQFEVPYICNAKLLLVDCQSVTAPIHYRNAGWLTQKAFVNAGGGTVPNARIDKTWFLLLRRPNLIIPNPGFADYGILIDVPYWYDDVSIRIWQYEGPASDAIAVKLNAMDVKLDLLLGN